MTRTLVVLALVVLVGAAGCNQPAKPPQRTPAPDLAPVTDRIVAAGASLEKSAAAAQEKVHAAREGAAAVEQDVKVQADTIRTVAPPVAVALDADARLAGDVTLYLDAAKVSLDDMQTQTPVVNQAGADIKAAQVQVMALAKERDAAQDAAAKAKDAAAKAAADLEAERAGAVRNLMLRLVLIGVLISVAAVPTFIWLSRSAGVAMLAGGLFLAGLASAVQQYLGYIQFGAVAMLAGGIGYLIWAAITHKNLSDLWQQGMTETVAAVDKIKAELTSDQLKAIFGTDGKIAAWVSDLQSQLYKLVKGAPPPPA